MRRSLMYPLGAVLLAGLSAVGVQASPAGGQDGAPAAGAGPGRRYIQGTFAAGSQSPGHAHSRVSPGVGGTVFDAGGAIGWFVGPAVALEAGLNVSSKISSPQHFSYNWFEHYVAKSRDAVAGVHVRGRPRGTRLLEYTAGAGLVVNRFTRSSIVETRRDPAQVVSRPDETETSSSLFVDAGVAVAIPIGRAVELVPGFSYRRVGRSENLEYYGVGDRSYHFTTTIRLRR